MLLPEKHLATAVSVKHFSCFMPLCLDKVAFIIGTRFISLRCIVGILIPMREGETP